MKNFTPEKINRSATILLNEKINRVFPLFGAFEERKWEPQWDPELIYPSEEIIAEGTTFYTRGKEPEEKYLWRVSKYDESIPLIQYFVSTQNRDWTITIRCESVESQTITKAIVTYSFLGLTPLGNQLNEAHLDRIYKSNLKDWEAAINSYLASH